MARSVTDKAGAIAVRHAMHVMLMRAGSYACQLGVGSSAQAECPRSRRSRVIGCRSA